ncbi:HlyD family secretion protein [Eisenibacter elegans]|jgi:HlyD family secretion protein|uniref:HlyD family secretion protein n=1 Tax=Eisenibacter elegans TaxID=997 RepID=UPI0003F9FF1F|nr:biotin/lipoyl-binding protein [Eisenibacter elegans]
MNKLIVWCLALGLLLSACQPEQTPTFEGKVYREVISVAPKIAGRVAKIYVTEGMEVQAGDTLALLEIPEVEAKRQQVEGLWQAADAQYQMTHNGATQEQIKRAEAQHQAAKDQYEFARKTLKRLEALVTDSLIAPQAFDEATAKYQMAFAQWQAAAAGLAEVKQGVRTEMRQAALGQRTQVAGVQQEVAIAERERVLIAPEAMTIETITLHQGELALPGYALFRGYAQKTAYIRLSVPEAIAVKHQPGEQWTLTLPHTQESLQATTISIRPLPAYANISSAYPQYALSEALYEIKLRPMEAKALLTHQTVLWQP